MGYFDEFRRTIPKFSFTSGAYDASGRSSQGSETASTIFASCQPLKPEEVQLLPEGRRDDGGTFRIYTDDVLQTITSENPDQIEIFGNRYEVFEQERWGNNIINHNKYLTLRVTTK